MRSKYKNKSIYLFLVSCLKKSLGNKYFWGNSISNEKIQTDTIRVPLKNGEVDYDYMESFVSYLETEKIRTLQAYLNASGLNNFELTPTEYDCLKNYSTKEFKNFKVTDVFSVKNTNNILSRDIIPHSGSIPYLCASEQNNAVSSYISYDKKFIEKGNCIFVGGKTFVVTYQKNDFYSNDSHNLAFYCEKEDNLDELTHLYLATCIEKSLSHKYSWGNSVSSKKIKDDEVKLPVVGNEIDFESMLTFIRAVQKLIIKDVVKYMDRKLQLTKQYSSYESSSSYLQVAESKEDYQK